MSTLIRPELSKKNKYWLSKHRFYELKHFCLQYPEWKALYLHEIGSGHSNNFLELNQIEWSDPTFKNIEKRSIYLEKMRLVEDAAKKLDPSLADYIFKAVTEGFSYTFLRNRLGIPCCKDAYYEEWRKFFYILDLMSQDLQLL